MTIRTVEMHTAGEPVRIVTGGLPVSYTHLRAHET